MTAVLILLAGAVLGAGLLAIAASRHIEQLKRDHQAELLAERDAAYGRGREDGTSITAANVARSIVRPFVGRGG